MDLVDKTSEEYKEPPKPKYIKFSGDGMSLGGSAKVEIDASAAVMEVDYDFKLDESQKTTKLQLNFHGEQFVISAVDLVCSSKPEEKTLSTQCHRALLLSPYY